MLLKRFRAWDEYEKKMEYCGLERIGSYHENVGNPIMQFTGYYDSTTWEELTEEERAKWTAVGNFPSQWIGRSIYEDDICRITLNGIIGIVEFYEGTFSFKRGDDYAFIIPENLKVIGNKYENEILYKEKILCVA